MRGRYEYSKDDLTEDEVLNSPVLQLDKWLKECTDAGVVEPNAMCLSTVGAEGRPSSRYVLLRGLDEDGLVFFTNYLSRKGRELAENPNACVTFWWPALERQVRVEGRVEKTTKDVSDAYFNSRPVESRIASAASPQSQPISREELQARLKAFGDPSRPAHWGGYRLIPDYFEFWQGRPARFHDRIFFRRTSEGWEKGRLAP